MFWSQLRLNISIDLQAILGIELQAYIRLHSLGKWTSLILTSTDRKDRFQEAEKDSLRFIKKVKSSRRGKSTTSFLPYRKMTQSLSLKPGKS